MLRWPMAAKEPSAIEAMARKVTICCHSCVTDGKAANSVRTVERHGGELWRRGEEGGDRRRRALIDVRRPHMERDRRDLEGEAGHQEDEAEDEAEIGARRLHRGGDVGEQRSSR